MTQLNIKLKDYNGPLDVLDTLIREHKMDILNLDIALISEQYLNFVNSQINTINIDDATEYLEMSTYLLLLKSKKIIPVDNLIKNDKSFEYERDKLVQRIIQYRKYKEITMVLSKKLEEREKSYSKNENGIEQFTPNSLFVEKMPNNIALEKISNAFLSAIEKYHKLAYARRKILVQELSINEVENQLWNFLITNKIKKITFSEYLERIDVFNLSQQFIVTTFLAILDLVKYNKIQINQLNDDNEIYLSINGD